ncbi:MAG TPA: hypothetical protein VFS20_24480 [Longimicrobium sp.]|nr:hypothetical protein [Longimicrobium sp.]
MDPALLRDPAFPEPFESAAILDEARGELGLLLWQTSRDVMLWVATAPDQRDELFVGGVVEPEPLVGASETEERLHAAVRELTELLRNGSEATAEQVAVCCETVARWAANYGLERTAIAFAQVAATACPAEAARYVQAGRLLVRYRRHTAADRRAFNRALKVSKRKGVRRVRARAHYGMMRVLAAVADYEGAKRHGATALRWFGDRRERIGVTHDLAALMMEQDSVANAWECSAMLRAVLPLRRSGADRIATLTLLVRAAGYAGQDAILADAWFDAVRAIGRLDDSPDAARHLLNLARTGRDTPGMEVARVMEAARLAFDVATRVADRQLALAADAFRLELLRA